MNMNSKHLNSNFPIIYHNISSYRYENTEVINTVDLY